MAENLEYFSILRIKMRDFNFLLSDNLSSISFSLAGMRCPCQKLFNRHVFQLNEIYLFLKHSLNDAAIKIDIAVRVYSISCTLKD